MSKSDDGRFTFRTPPLRNVELTAPYMHAGAFNNLRDAIVHHVRPEESLKDYNGYNLAGLHKGVEKPNWRILMKSSPIYRVICALQRPR